MAFQRLSVAIAAALLVLMSTFASAQDASVVAVPSNTSDYTNNETALQQIVIGIMTSTSANGYNLSALTPQANNSVDHSAGANVSNVPLTDARPQDIQNTTNQASNGPVALVSCDNSTYSGDVTMAGTISQAISTTGNGGNASSILLYSLNANFCNLTASLSQQFGNYSKFYTTVSSGDAHNILNQLNSAGGAIVAYFGTQQSFSNYMQSQRNNPNGFGTNIAGTNVAMIILYSITGVIALLFVVIIVTGAVRAHRHPERYGPRNVTGRPRQTRAAGIGRAMLETIPLVKFGESPPPKSTDIEMNGGSTTERNAAGTTEGADADATASGARKSGESTAARSTTTTKAEESGKHAVGMDHAEKVEKSLECAICWEDFEKGEEVRMLPCEHKFHPKCIDPWLLGFSGTCPVCRIAFGQPSSSKEERSSGEQNEGPRSGGGNGGASSGNGSGS